LLNNRYILVINVHAYRIKERNRMKMLPLLFLIALLYAIPITIAALPGNFDPLHHGYFNERVLVNPLVLPKKDTFHVFSGYVQNDMFLDTRRIVSGRDGSFLLYPARPDFDIEGNDINARPNANMQEIRTRLRWNVYGPDLWGASTYGMIETDFLGITDETMLSNRIRHAYFQLDWETFSLLCGGTWHPLYFPINAPETVSFDSGTPINPFARVPQLRLTYYRSWFDVVLAFAVEDKIHFSDGPDGFTTFYKRFGVIPDISLSGIGHICEHRIGAGVHYKRIAPRLSSDTNYKVYEFNNSVSAIGWAQFMLRPVMVTLKGVYGQNLTSALSFGGYAVYETDPATDERKYTNLRMASGWIEIVVEKSSRFQPALFAGYAVNLGAKKIIPNSSLVYGLGTDVAFLARISPRLWIKYNPLVIGLEFQVNHAGWGTLNDHAKPVNAVPVTDWRFQCGLFYLF